jgi:hypothetical protein
MTTSDIIRLRLHHQQLVQPQFKTPAEVVRWLGAVQAQDYLHTLWGIGQRLKNVTEPEIEKAVAEKSIVRSWPMRGTLHFVPSEDLRWMLKYLTPRIVKRQTTMFLKAGLDKTVFNKSRKIIIDALEGGKQLTREELYRALEKKKIPTDNVRGLHILFVLAQEQLICFGSRQGKQQTFTLMDEWLPPSKEIAFDEALGRLALRYFTSHGPAQVQDLAWWAGLTQTEAKAGLESVKSKLARETTTGKEYWLSPDIPSGKTIPNVAHLLSVYDEYGIAYKDRSVLADGERAEKLKGRDFLNMMMFKGRIAGFWKRTLDKTQVNVELTSLTSLKPIEKSALEKTVKEYGKFLGLPAKLEMS